MRKKIAHFERAGHEAGAAVGFTPLLPIGLPLRHRVGGGIHCGML
jgi:hypothetical protein